MRTLLAFGFLLALLAGLHHHTAAADEPKAKPPELTVKLGTIPDIKLGERPPVDEAQTKRIKEMITDLAKLDSADVGLSATFSGSDFAPIPGQSHVGTLLLTDHQVKRSQALRDLVALGPDALPLLLDALDDQTPTKIVVKHAGGFGAMWHGGELDLNPVNPAEAAVYKARVEARKKATDGVFEREDGKTVESHTVTVGDVCFVAVGQIVGRGYSAVRYQPSACIVINSPTHDAKLCAEVRAAWGGKEPAKRLFDSLLADYATEGVFNGKSLDGWYSGHYLQCGAAMRLLYYFPKESAKLIAERLEKLDVGKADGDFMLQWVANRVRPDEFIKAVAWCENPAVGAAATGVFKRAERREDLLAALPAIADVKLIRERLEPLIDKLPAEERGPYGDGYHLLIGLAERTPESAKAVFQTYLKDGSQQRHQTVCLAFQVVKVAWDVEVLGPLLTDTRKGYMNYRVEPENNKVLESTRLCDDAATALAMHHPELKFTLAGTHADLDKQIAVIREQLNRKR
jgi:hypothetical protein